MIDRPHTLRSPIDGRILHRDVRPSTVSFGGRTVVIDLPGYYPVGAGEGFHYPEDLEVSDRALAQIKAECAQAGAPAVGPAKHDVSFRSAGANRPRPAPPGTVRNPRPRKPKAGP